MYYINGESDRKREKEREKERQRHTERGSLSLVGLELAREDSKMGWRLSPRDLPVYTSMMLGYKCKPA